MKPVLLTGRWPADEAVRWQAALQAAAPEWRFCSPDEAAAQASDIEVAVVANPAPGVLRGWPRLRLIQSLWAGVDALLGDATLPPGVPIARMVDPTLTQAMVETAVWAVIGLHRDFPGYARDQAARRWRQRPQRPAADCPVLVLGRGVLGRAVGQALAALGYPVTHWASADGRADLPPRLAQADVLVDLLPLTPQTRGLLAAPVLRGLRRGAGLVNLARGAHLVEADLLAALADGAVGHAVLDVFGTEPLPPAHPFWRHPQVTVLPHVAALTDPTTAAAVVADNLRRLAEGQPLQHLVDRSRGY